MAGTIKHKHQTVIAPSGADVDRDEWNNSLAVAGGIDGQVMARDSGQTDGWKFIDFPTAFEGVRFHSDLGGSRQISVPNVASDQDAIDYQDIEIDGDAVAGFTVRVRVEVRTANAGTSVTPKLRNITDASDAVVGAACSATTYAGTNGIQILTFTPASGVKKYRLQLTPSNTTNDVFGIGHIEIFA